MRLALPALLCALAGCFPTFDDRPWIVDDTRVLAVRGVPAEQRPGGAVEYQALVVAADGSFADSPEWAYCMRPRSVEERNSVTASCARGDDLQPIAQSAIVLSDACTRFGPNPPPVEAGEPARRPADPDPTGGYYLPVRARVGDGALAFGFQRIRCDLAGATRAIFDEYEDRYTLNEHPSLAGAAARLDGSEVDLLAGRITVDAGATADLTAIPATDAAEPYVVYIAEEVALFDRTEVVSVNWYVTDGDLGLATGVDTTWRAPATPGPVHGWIVVRDDRGGASWASFAIDVR